MKLTETEKGLLGASLALMPKLDKDISNSVRNSKKNKGLDNIMKIGLNWGDPLALETAAGLYLLPATAAIGKKALQAILISGLITGCLKFITGRARPDKSPDNSTDFKFIRGTTDRFQSFPSGHATAAFAFAVAVDKSWGTESIIKPLLLYSLAGITAISRVYHDRHWTSDVITGSVIGYVVGRKI
jgi:membrane-associated phospholipid phosphatase